MDNEVFIIEFFDWYEGGSKLKCFSSLDQAAEFIGDGAKLKKGDHWKRYTQEDFIKLCIPDDVVEAYFSTKLQQGIYIHKSGIRTEEGVKK